MSAIYLYVPTSDSLLVNTGLFIDNAFVAAADGSTPINKDPCNGESLATIAAAQEVDVDRVVASSLEAFKLWRKDSPSTSRRLLNKLADVVERDAAILSSLESLDAEILFRDSTRLHIYRCFEISPASPVRRTRSTALQCISRRATAT